jgi:hypothetical protein
VSKINAEKEWIKLAKDIVPTFDKGTQTERVSPTISPMTRIRQILEETNKETTSSMIILAHGKKDSSLMRRLSSHAEVSEIQGQSK